MSHDDVLFDYRLRLFTLADDLGKVSEACRRIGRDASALSSGRLLKGTLTGGLRIDTNARPGRGRRAAGGEIGC
jgi:hypothetical protein